VAAQNSQTTDVVCHFRKITTGGSYSFAEADRESFTAQTCRPQEFKQAQKDWRCGVSQNGVPEAMELLLLKLRYTCTFKRTSFPINMNDNIMYF
jgi:hypothetical protein